MQSGDQSGKDLEHPGRQPTARTLSNVRAASALLDQDRCATVRQVAAELQISTSTAQR